jgi:diadenosine tetraphosphate (Ap4A) HIT family hydrolase
VLAAPDLAVALPNLILQTDTVVAVLNRRPVAPGHVTLILKAHWP